MIDIELRKVREVKCASRCCAEDYIWAATASTFAAQLGGASVGAVLEDFLKSRVKIAEIGRQRAFERLCGD